MEMPITLSLHLRSFRASAPWMVTNSDPNTDVSTVDCLFVYHCTIAVLTFVMKPLFDLCNFLSPAWSLSMIKQISTSYPLGSGTFMGIASIAS